MPNERGIKKTKVPLLYQVNYPEQSQIGFLVKGKRRGQEFHKIFNFSQFPSEKACYKMAAAKAKKLQKLFPILSRREYAQIKRKNFKNKVVGVRKLISKAKEFEYGFWEASWSPKVGMVKKRRFSIHKYGGDEAKKLALQARKEGLESMKH